MDPQKYISDREIDDFVAGRPWDMDVISEMAEMHHGVDPRSLGSDEVMRHAEEKAKRLFGRKAGNFDKAIRDHEEGRHVAPQELSEQYLRGLQLQYPDRTVTLGELKLGELESDPHFRNLTGHLEDPVQVQRVAKQIVQDILMVPTMVLADEIVRERLGTHPKELDPCEKMDILMHILPRVAHYARGKHE